jgi:hypothetical protein
MRYQRLSTVCLRPKLRNLGLEELWMLQKALALRLYGTSWLSEA